MENKTELPLVAVDGIPVEKPAEHKPVMTWASTGEAVAQHHQCGPECTVEHAITASPTAAQRCDEGHGFPVAMGRLGHKPAALGTPAAQRRHVRLDPGLSS